MSRVMAAFRGASNDGSSTVRAMGVRTKGMIAESVNVSDAEPLVFIGPVIGAALAL